MAQLKIGVLAQRTGTNAPTIRYYEEIGLLPRPRRRLGGQRLYGEEDVRRLTFIRRCREFGFSIEQVRALVTIVHDRRRPCMEVRDLAQEHLLGVRAKLEDLLALERDLVDFVKKCDDSCAGGPGPECVVLQELACSKRSRRVLASTAPTSPRR